MSQKELVLNAFARLPDDCTFDDMVERLRFLAALEEGRDQLKRGESVTHEEVKKNIASWLSE